VTPGAAGARFMEPVTIWGVPLRPWTFRQALDAVDDLVRAGRPGFVITANLHYTMLTARHPELREVNRRAAFIVADGMPLVWASRWHSVRLPERVAGSDLLPALCERAAERGYGVFLLGGAEGVAQVAAERLMARFSGLRVVGVASPPFRELTAAEHAALVAQVRSARPDLLFTAFSQPRGEQWLAAHCEELGVPVCLQVGAAVDFVAGRVARAPRILQRCGMEWAYRLGCEPRRLASRYLSNGWFALQMVARDLLRRSRPTAE
jgi:N-acetylglucosaminyldiphosphoundecaprenol N-acetyl-beta-D-mannosaminyltransferase